MQVYKNNSAKLYKEDKYKERNKYKSYIKRDLQVSIQRVSKKLYNYLYILNIIYLKNII